MTLDGRKTPIGGGEIFFGGGNGIILQMLSGTRLVEALFF